MDDVADLAAGKSDRDDGKVLPWTVKGIPPEARNAATQAAKRAEKTIGEWLDGAIRVAVKAEREEKRAVVKAATAIVAMPLAEVQQAAEVASAFSAATGRKVPRRLARQIERQLLANLGG